MIGCRIVGVGQPLAGDDGAGPAVIAWLRSIALPAGVHAHTVPELCALIPLLDGPGALPLVVVDAVLAHPPGQVTELSPWEIAARSLESVSGQGMSVGQALALADARRPAGVAPPDVQLVAISIVRPRPGDRTLSPVVAAAVPLAADLALALAMQAMQPVPLDL
ncbi:MAG TPA: hydrogenase maturation protease [Polyangia bacterium]|nr:hydrogenase maturation protease [Polyangia bacterium]